MRKILIYSLFCNFALANGLDVLQNDKKELRNLEKKIIETSYKSLKMIGFHLLLLVQV